MPHMSQLEREDLERMMDYDEGLKNAMKKYAISRLSTRPGDSKNPSTLATIRIVFLGPVSTLRPAVRTSPSLTRSGSVGPPSGVPVLRPSMSVAFDKTVPRDSLRLRSYTQTFVGDEIPSLSGDLSIPSDDKRRKSVGGGEGYTISKIVRRMSPVAAVAHLDVHDLVSACDGSSDALLKRSDTLSHHGRGTEDEVTSVCSDGRSRRHAATVVWLGILIDGIPESLVIGILVSTSPLSSVITFVFGVFMANLPEAMSSSATMLEHGVSRIRVFLMWSSIVIITALGAALGSLIFPPISADETTLAREVMIAMIEGCGGGAMLAMIAETALPEASHASSVTGLVGTSAVAGFLSTLFVKSLA